MKNTSGINIKGVKVLIKPFVSKETFEGSSMIVMPEDLRAKEELAVTEGILVSVGPLAWIEEKEKGIEPDAQVGDHVIFSRYAGQTRTGLDGEVYRIINDHDIIATVDKHE